METPIITTFEEYQKAARVTAMYTDTTRMPAITGIMYAALGLVDEMQEFFEALEALRHQPTRIDTTLLHDCSHLWDEAGDVMWYCANIATDINFILNTDDNMHGHGGAFTVKETLFQHCATITGSVKKIYRDEDVAALQSFPLTVSKQFQPKIFNTWKSLLEIVAIMQENLYKVYLDNYMSKVEPLSKEEFFLQMILQRNIKKLYSRMERKVLTGDGDNR